MLKDNYRSSQHILDTSKSLIDKNLHRVVSKLQGLEKTLSAKNKAVAKSKVRPEFIAYPNRAHEDASIVQQLEEMRNAGIPLNEVAIIYAKHKQARNIISLLEKKKIPYNTRRRVNVLEQPMIQNVRLLLEYIYAEYSLSLIHI